MYLMGLCSEDLETETLVSYGDRARVTAHSAPPLQGGDHLEHGVVLVGTSPCSQGDGPLGVSPEP